MTEIATGSLAAAGNAALASGVKMPAGLTRHNSNELGQEWFHLLLYGDTDSRKTTTAAKFGSPNDSLIVFTRRKEQAKPLQGLGYEFFLAENAEALNYALTFPQELNREWAKSPNRTLILDDASAATTMLIDASDAGDAFGRDVKEAGKILRQHIVRNMKLPQHFIMTALAKVDNNRLTKEERIAPDLPPSIMALVNTEVEHAYYVRKRNWKLLTKEDSFTYEEYDPEQKKFVNAIRIIFAKNKMPLALALRQPPVLAQEETMDLAAIWNKIVAAQGVKK